MRPSGTHLYKRVCPSVRWSIRPSVRPSFRPYVRPLRKCKIRVFRLFLAMMRSYTESNDRQICHWVSCVSGLVSRGHAALCLSVSEGRSVGWSVMPVPKPRFAAVFGHGEILYWNKWSTNMIWEPPLLLSRFTRLFVHLSFTSYHMINKHSPDASLPGRACWIESELKPL